MIEAAVRNPMDAKGAIAGALVLAAIGASFYNLLPLVVGVAQDGRGWSDTQVGFLGTAFYAGFNIVTISAFFWIRRFGWRAASWIAAPIAAAAMLVGLWLEGYFATLGLFAVGGGAFGALYCIATVAIGDTTHEARWFGAKIATETFFAGVLLLGLPALVIIPFGFSGLLVVLAIQAVAAMIFVPLLPRFGAYGEPQRSEADDPMIPEGGNLAIWLALIVTLLFFTGQTAIWAFLERVGDSAGFDASALGLVLTLSLFSAMLGSLFQAAVIERFGLQVMLALACTAVVVGTFIFARADTVELFGVGACIFMLGVGIAVPATISAVSALDFSGRFTALTVPALGLGAMFGPGLAGVVSSAFGNSGFEYLAIATAAGTLLLNFLAMSKAPAKEAQNA